MDEYGGIGGVLGAATVLPATGAMALWFSDKTNQVVLYAMLSLVILSLVTNVAMIVRYLRNLKQEA